MCFIISMVLLVLSYNFFMAENLLLASGSLLGAIIFMFFMIKNIQYVRNLKKKKQDDN